jgi:hypothetical protein
VRKAVELFTLCPQRRPDFHYEDLQDFLGRLNSAEADMLRGNKIHPFTGKNLPSVMDVGADLVAMLLGRMPAELSIEESAPAPKEKGLEPGSQPAESSATADTDEKKRTQTRRPAKAAAK